MLKKIFVLSLLFGFTSLANANNATTLTVAPYEPSEWGYHAARVYMNQPQPFFMVGNGITIDVAIHDVIFLEVAAMNARPVLDDSCKNIEIKEPGQHLLLFELKPDWRIHCQYSFTKIPS